MLARRPELTMELIMPDSRETESAVVTITASKGRKYVFRDGIRINETDAQRLKKYFEENLTTRIK
jgi:hypothetical protein